MIRLRFIFIVVLLSFISLGCATTPSNISSDTLSKVNRIAVISLLGDKIQWRHIGTTVFTNKADYMQVEWGIDQFVEEIISEQISNYTDYQIIDIEFNKEKLSAQEIENIYDSDTDLPGFYIDARKMKEYLKKVSNSYNIDTLILVTRGYGEVPGTNQYVHGYSLKTQKALFVVTVKPQLSIYAMLKVIDLNTMQELAMGGIFGLKDLDNKYSKKEFSELSEQDLKLLEDSLKDILMEKVPSALQVLRLKPIDYSNDIDETEATIIAEDYILEHLSYHCSVSLPFDDGDTWYLKILKCQSGPVGEEIPESISEVIIVDKKTGEVIWD